MNKITNLPTRISNRLRLEIKKRKIEKLYNKAIKKHPERFKEIRTALEYFHEGGGYKRNKQDYKVFELYQILLKVKPKKSIEIGSGSSSYAFARYVNENLNSQHITVDESEKWLNNTRKTIQSMGIDSDRISWIKAEKAIKEGSERAEISLLEDFKECFDLVFIDGPTLKVNEVQDSRHINTDIFKIFDHCPPKFIVVDIRFHTVKEIQKRIGDYYSWEESHLFGLIKKPVKNHFNYFSVFKRKSLN